MARITRAISIKQPFVEQILVGLKRREYRNQATRIRERVYLYASLKPRTDPREWRKVRKRPGELPSGAIVGTVEIIGCESDGAGGFAYVLRNPKRLRRALKARNRALPRFWIPEF